MPSLSPYMPLQYLPPELQDKRKQFFTYTITYKTGSPNPGGGQLAASATNAQTSTNIQADAYFLLIALSGEVRATDDATVTANPAITLQILDSGASQALSDFPVLWDNTFGTAQNPFFLPYPRIFQPNAIITTGLNNLIATAKNVYMAFHGFKVYAPLGTIPT